MLDEKSNLSSYMRKTAGFSLLDLRQNLDILKDVANFRTTKNCRLKWLQHVQHMDNSRILTLTLLHMKTPVKTVSRQTMLHYTIQTPILSLYIFLSLSNFNSHYIVYDVML
jgi:hypothetical protein